MRRSLGKMRGASEPLPVSLGLQMAERRPEKMAGQKCSTQGITRRSCFHSFYALSVHMPGLSGLAWNWYSDTAATLPPRSTVTGGQNTTR